MELHIIKLIRGSIDNGIFCGITYSAKGAAKIMSFVSGKKPIDQHHAINTAAGLFIKIRQCDNTFFHIGNITSDSLDIKDGKCWVITEKIEGYSGEKVRAVTDSKLKALTYVEHEVEEPYFRFKDKCNIIEIDGYKPFTKFMGRDNPELNRVYYTIYERTII